MLPESKTSTSTLLKIVRFADDRLDIVQDVVWQNWPNCERVSCLKSPLDRDPGLAFHIEQRLSGTAFELVPTRASKTSSLFLTMTLPNDLVTESTLAIRFRSNQLERRLKLREDAEDDGVRDLRELITELLGVLLSDLCQEHHFVGCRANSTFERQVCVTTITSSSQGQEASVADQKTSRLAKKLAELTLIKIHVVKVQLELELLNLRNLRHQT